MFVGFLVYTVQFYSAHVLYNERSRITYVLTLRETNTFRRNHVVHFGYKILHVAANSKQAHAHPRTHTKLGPTNKNNNEKNVTHLSIECAAMPSMMVADLCANSL